MCAALQSGGWGPPGEHAAEVSSEDGRAYLHSLSLSSTCAQKSRDTMSMLPAAISSYRSVMCVSWAELMARMQARTGRVGSAVQTVAAAAAAASGGAPSKPCALRIAAVIANATFRAVDAHHSRLHLRLAPSHCPAAASLVDAREPRCGNPIEA